MTARTAPLAQCLTDDRCLILTLDDAFVEVLGRPRDEIVGRSPLEFTAPLDQAFNDALLQRLERDGFAFTITKRYIRGDGTLLWVSNHVSSFRDGLGPRRMLATCELRSEPEIVTEVARVRQDALNLARIMTSSKMAFGEDLIGSPALEALLHLHLAEMEGRSLTSDEIAALVTQSRSTTLRWIRVLVERRLVEVERDLTLDGIAPLRITLLAQRMMEQVAGSLRQFAD